MLSVVFLDTSVLLNILNVPRKNESRDDVIARYKALVLSGALLIIPIAVVIEVGNHIAQLTGGEPRAPAMAFADILKMSLRDAAPWVVSGASWDRDFLRQLVDGHSLRPGMVVLCQSGVGTGDGSILLELEGYRQRSDLPSGLPVGLWSLDEGLQAYA